ncbi:MoxR family ATPase [Synechococcus sp. KORDI-100]|uniref:AAA family ATPase n=1 Tax=Synechococcus sp. KORDI-100 TaxID=1280380 RepID=UPI00194FE80F
MVPVRLQESAIQLHQLIQALSTVLLGKQHQVRLALCCLIAGGHLLIEDRPGMGKSTLAESLARSCALAFKRVSFTSDLLPADLTGLTVFDPATASFRFQPGPVFTQVLLADEINRASPRTQSALLEAMAAGRVSVDGTSHPLPDPFFVIATQNSLDQVGTSPLPEAQLDRFLMRLSLGYPDRAAERTLLMGEATPMASQAQVLESAQLIEWQTRCRQQYCSQQLIDYVLDLVQATRQGGVGLSPRASQGLIAAARAWSLFEQRPHVTLDDVQIVCAAVVEHRLDGGIPSALDGGAPLSQALLQQVNALR